MERLVYSYHRKEKAMNRLTYIYHDSDSGRLYWNYRVQAWEPYKRTPYRGYSKRVERVMDRLMPRYGLNHICAAIDCLC